MLIQTLLLGLSTQRDECAPTLPIHKWSRTALQTTEYCRVGNYTSLSVYKRPVLLLLWAVTHRSYVFFSFSSGLLLPTCFGLALVCDWPTVCRSRTNQVQVTGPRQAHESLGVMMQNHKLNKTFAKRLCNQLKNWSTQAFRNEKQNHSAVGHVGCSMWNYLKSRGVFSHRQISSCSLNVLRWQQFMWQAYQ